ncbi:hypothetical protein HY837_02000 [archaeon]|nr:hypothetical protein [archaeon]
MLVVFTVYVPTNSGLKYVREEGIRFLEEKFKGLKLNVSEQRGEDIPELVKNFYEYKAPVIGITGEDLLDNYLLENFSEDEFVRAKYRKELVLQNLGLKNKGQYKNSAFGLPALCILGKEGIPLEKFVKAYPQVRTREITQLRGTELQEPCFEKTRVAIPKRYEKLITSRVKLTGAEILLLEGKVDVTVSKGDADYAIDIVLTGRTCKEELLGFFPPVLYLSDGVVLGNKKSQEKPKQRQSGISDFDVWLNTGRILTSSLEDKCKFSH